MADSFVASAALPDVLTTTNGSHVRTPETWVARRFELKALLQQHILGALPPTVPTLTSATLLNQTSGGLSSAYVRLGFLANTSMVHVDINLAWRQADTARVALPVFLTQFNHRGWALAGVQRGYLSVLYPGGDTRDVSDDFRAAYPAATFRKILARAFVASRVVDFLCSKEYARLGGGGGLTLPRIDRKRISISGHSRNGKQSLVAAAFDDRFAAVVGSSPGTPIAAPVRFSSPDFNGETLNYVSDARDWWLPSLHSYFGREHELPADGHFVLALIAPRHVLLATALSDGEGDVTFADEQNVLAASRAFALLGAADALRIRWRPARHHGALDVQSYFDWFDRAAGAGTAGVDLFPQSPLHAFDWRAWSQSVTPPPPPPPPTAPLRERVLWLLGGSASLEAGSADGLTAGSHYCETGDEGSAWAFASELMMRDSLPRCLGGDCLHSVRRHSLSFGAYVTADLFVPAEAPPDVPLPVVIFQARPPRSRRHAVHCPHVESPTGCQSAFSCCVIACLARGALGVAMDTPRPFTLPCLARSTATPTNLATRASTASISRTSRAVSSTPSPAAGPPCSRGIWSAWVRGSRLMVHRSSIGAIATAARPGWPP